MKTPRVTLGHLWALTVVVGIFVFLNTHPIRPHDFWWHLKVGELIVTTGEIPTTDPFSLTQAGTPYTFWVFWLVDSAFYVLYRLGGPALIIFAHAAAITAGYALVTWLSHARSGSWRSAAFAALFAAALGVNDWNVRPQAVGFPLAAAMLWAIHAYRRRPRRALLLVFPLCQWIWANSHGAFPIGLVLVGLWLADEGWRALRERPDTVGAAWTRLQGPAVALALAGGAGLLTPKGPRIVTYLLNMAGDPRIRTMIPEWAPPTWATLGGKLFFLAFGLSTVILALSWKKITARDFLTFVTFGVLALRTSRGVIWFGLVMAPILADHGSALWRRLAQRIGLTTSSNPGIPALNTALLSVLLLAAVGTLPWFKAALPLPPANAGLLSAETPVEATAYLLETELPGPLFHDLAFGSYLIWAAAPEYRVFVDTRIELYPIEVWRDYLAISAAEENWEQRLAAYDVRTLMLSPWTQGTLVEAAGTSENWREIYADETTVLFTRMDAPASFTPD
jgi:hypothetical protein